MSAPVTRPIAELEGVLPALVTPLRRDREVDEPAVGRLVEHVLAAGVTGLVPLGSTGETASLPEHSRRQMLSACADAARGRVPVICGIAQPNLTSALADVAAARTSGAAAVLLAPPFYYPMDQPTILDFYRRVADAGGLPILVYNIPQFTKVSVEPATLAQLASEGVIAGIKDSSRDYEYFERICLAVRDFPSFRTFTGSDWMLLGSLAIGAVGTICGAANVAPGWVVRVFDAYRAGRWSEAREYQFNLLELMAALRVGAFPSGIKAALEMQGVCESWPVPPVAPLADGLKDTLKMRMQSWGLARAETVTAGL
jgi:4-hydroxy-tetrahydrodipicolinate synthase